MLGGVEDLFELGVLRRRSDRMLRDSVWETVLKNENVTLQNMVFQENLLIIRKVPPKINNDHKMSRVSLISNRFSHISDRKIESIAYMWWKGKEITNRWCICLLELCQIDGSGVLERVLPRRVNRCHSVVVAHYYSEALHSLRFIEFCSELG